MWMYSGPEDTARTNPKEVDEDTVAQWPRSITGNKDNPGGFCHSTPTTSRSGQAQFTECFFLSIYDCSWIQLILVTCVLQIFTKMYSMPNGEQYQEGVESDGESGDYQYAYDSEEDSEDSGSSKEVDSPLRSERRSKQSQDPAGGRGKAVSPSEKMPKRTRTSTPDPSEKAAKQPKVVPPKPRKALPRIKVVVPVASAAATSATSMDIDEEHGDAETADAATSRAVPTNVIQLPDDDDDEVLQRNTGRKSRTSSRRVPASKVSRSASEPVVQQLGDPVRTTVSFADPLSTDQPTASTAQASGSTVPTAPPQAPTPPAPSSAPFVLHHVPEDQTGAAKEAMIQAGLMMDRLKVVYDTSKAAYDASSALQANVRKACELGTKYADLEKKQIQLNLDLELAKENLKKARDEADVMGDKMKQALEQKDLDLATAQKTVREKTELAGRKLASVGKLEEENAKLKTAVDEAKKEVVQLKEEKVALANKVDVLTRKRDELEAYLGGLAKKMFLMLEEFYQNFEEETGRIETGLDPINSPVKDEAAMNVVRLESRLASVLDYLARLKVALSRINKELWPEDVFQNDLESLMTRLNDIPNRVQAWKKSSARCGTDVALSLVRVHCKDAKEEKLKALQVANTKKLQFQSFMETFIDAATRIANGIDLDTFVEPASPPAE
ncbi:hypothetical protein VPH35_135554 [Triticum aestivum]